MKEGNNYYGEPCRVEEVMWEYDGEWSATVLLDRPADELKVEPWEARLNS